MRESFRERQATDIPSPNAEVLAPLPVEVQRKRRRLVRILAAATLLGGIALSLIPLPHSMLRDGDTGHSHGFPFRAMTFKSQDGENLSASAEVSSILANIGVAAGIAVGISLLRRRRPRNG